MRCLGSATNSNRRRQRHGYGDAHLHVITVQLIVGNRTFESHLQIARNTTVEDMETHLRVFVFLAFVGKKITKYTISTLRLVL